jgi:hypothetical protein
LKTAGADRPIFTPNALESIYSYSGGIPRLVNVLCDNALLTGYALRQREIDTRIIQEVAADLSITTNAEPPPVRQIVNSTNGNGSSRSSIMGSVESRSGVARSEPRPIAVRQVHKDPLSMASVPRTFFDALVAGLTEAMGPMAKIVLRDQINALGESSETFPREKLGMLVELVSGEVLDERMRLQFQRLMLQQIRTLPVS